MFTKATLGLAVILATASGALAAMKTYNVDPSHPAYTNVYNPPAPTSAQIRISTSPYGNGGTDSIEALRTQPTFGPTA